MDSSVQHHIDFTKKVLVKKIIEQNLDLSQLKLLKVEVTSNDELNGFTSNILMLNLVLENNRSEEIKKDIVIKLQKGTKETRINLMNDILFVNEITIYNKIIPAFLNKFRSNLKTINPDLWCPKIYLAEVGKYPELSEFNETILAVENLSPSGYRLAGRYSLTPAELILMTKPISQWHALSYALRIQKDTLLEELRSHMIQFRFKQKEGKCFYDTTYAIAFERLFNYIDSSPETIDSEELRVNIELLRSKFRNTPLDLMEQLLDDDPDYSVILHGDFNRNNILFRYDEASSPVDMRMIDFQLTRYGSPAIDLSFCCYMNVHPDDLKSTLFERIFESYHTHLIAALCELLCCSEDDERLAPYKFNHFLAHFKKFASYGAMVSVQFLPWIICPADECKKLANLWFTDLNSSAFREIALVCGGDEANKRIIDILRLATRLSHMDILQK